MIATELAPTHLAPVAAVSVDRILDITQTVLEVLTGLVAYLAGVLRGRRLPPPGSGSAAG